MKPTQCELIIECFKRHGGAVTLGQLLSEGYGTFGHKVTARISELRQKGYSITCTKGPNPSQNLYTMAPPMAPLSFDETGQGVFA